MLSTSPRVVLGRGRVAMQFAEDTLSRADHRAWPRAGWSGTLATARYAAGLGTVAVLLVSCGLFGCSQQRGATETPSAATADGVLQRMLSVYQHARSYQDRAVVRLQYRQDGKAFEDEAPLAVSWEKPNRLRVRAYQAEVVCDGTQFVARLHDEGTRDFDGQVVVREAPDQIALSDLWDRDDVLSLAFRQGLAGYPLQLDLLLSESPLAALLQDGEQRSLLEPARLDGNLCHRVSVATDDGEFVLWVDQDSSVLRRIEYPAETFAPEIAADESVDDLRLTVDCRAAAVNERSAGDAFAVHIAGDAKRVKRLIPPPRELPSDLFGKIRAPYAFESLSGQAVSDQSLGDRIKVLAWFNNHPACQSTVQQLNQVYHQYQSESRIAFQAVCAEAGSFTAEQLESLARYWQVDLPIVRDVQAVGRDLFHIPWAPTLVVLNERNVVQIYEIGANPNLVAELPQVLEQLLAGTDVAANILDQYRHERSRYEEALRRGEPEDAAVAANSSPIASPTRPQILQLRPLWDNAQVGEAGNLLALPAVDGQSRFLVQEGWRTVAEIGGQGSLVARHTLDLPPRAGVSQLQTATDSADQRFYVGWALRGRQVHVFDAQWHRQLSYPEEGREHEGVQDALLTDLDDDGQLELLVGFWGQDGVECVTLGGKRLWANQEMTHVISLMQTPRQTEPGGLWVSSATGAVMRLDGRGNAQRICQNTGQLVHHLFRGQDADHSSVPFAAICYGPEGRRLALGLNREGHAAWRYSLPPGAFSSQLRFVSSACLLEEQAACWVIAGADGSLHLLSSDGKFTDHFNTGRVITGVAGGRMASAGLLVVSSDDGVHAWQVSPPATAQAQ